MFEFFTPMTMKNAVFLDVTLFGSCKNDVSEELIACIIRLKGIIDLGTTLALSEL
jgi:hypothetical protein